MSTAFEYAKEVVNLIDSMKELKEQVSNMGDRLAGHHDRLLQLEMKEEVILEKAKNAFLQSAHETHGKILERVITLENRIAQDPRLGE